MNKAARQCSFVLLLLMANVAVSSQTETAWLDYLRNDSRIGPAMTFPHTSCFNAAAAEHNLPVSLLLAIARGESDFDADARSKANAHGVMQIQWPGTAKHLGINRLTDLYDPCTNIDAGTRYVKELLKRYNDNVHLALAAYNYGPSRITADGAIPSGAEWYSGYIYNHLEYVLGDRNNNSLLGEQLYSDLGRSTLISFGEPYRAAAFAAGLRERAPDLQLDWFRVGVGDFAVVLVYDSRQEFDDRAAELAAAGFTLN